MKLKILRPQTSIKTISIVIKYQLYEFVRKLCKYKQSMFCHFSEKGYNIQKSNKLSRNLLFMLFNSDIDRLV